jgi:hypothetical protein
VKYEARLRLRNLASGKAAVRQRIKDRTGLESFEQTFRLGLLRPHRRTMREWMFRGHPSPRQRINDRTGVLVL